MMYLAVIVGAVGAVICIFGFIITYCRNFFKQICKITEKTEKKLRVSASKSHELAGFR